MTQHMKQHMTQHTGPINSLWLHRVALALGVALGLYGVVVVYSTGQTLLAVTLLVLCALAAWAYTSARAQALPYLFPGVAAALIFVVFPMLYTVSMGFTNQSTRNLLSEQQAREHLMQEAVSTPGSQRAFSLHGMLNLATQVQLYLPATASAPALISAALQINDANSKQLALQTSPDVPATPALSTREVISLLPTLRQLSLHTPEGSTLTLISLREFAQVLPLYVAQPGGALIDRITQTAYLADTQQGFYTSAQGDQLQPGFRVPVGFSNFARLFSEAKFREPFISVFTWTLLFSAISVMGAAGLGLLLAVLFNWESLQFRGAYRMVLFLPYAVPGFISILIFKGLFNQNLGEINFLLNGLFGIKPAWFSDPVLAKLMLLIVNIWLGFPYMMVLCSGLIKSIPSDLYEASAIAGAGPLMNFYRITLPLILKPLTPLLISAFAFNFNNFVLVSLLTSGRPDQADATLPAGTTDILVSYTWRIAFEDTGQQFGLAAAISTVIFLIVVAITLIQMRFTRINHDESSR
jgi:maltose/maltodextrin transport system permease protein